MTRAKEAVALMTAEQAKLVYEALVECGHKGPLANDLLHEIRLQAVRQRIKKPKPPADQMVMVEHMGVAGWVRESESHNYNRI